MTTRIISKKKGREQITRRDRIEGVPRVVAGFHDINKGRAWEGRVVCGHGRGLEGVPLDVQPIFAPDVAFLSACQAVVQETLRKEGDVCK